MNAISVTSFPRNILVVDDEEIVRQVLGQALSARGWNVIEAADGELAIEKLNLGGFGCMVVDKNLPGINGLDVIRHGRRLQPFCATIIMTAYASIDSAVQALRLGASDYLLKPFDDINIVTLKVEQSMKNAQVHFENGRLITQIREMASELETRDERISKQGTEIEMFEKVLQFSVEHEVKDAKNKIIELERELDDNVTVSPRVLDNTMSLLRRVRAVFKNDKAEQEVLRDTLQQVVRVLEKNVELLAKPGE